MNKLEKDLLLSIADLHKIPQGSVSFRKDGESVQLTSTAEIEIVKKLDKPGIDIIVKPNVKGKSVHLPVIITKSGVTDVVYNDFYIGENSEVTIIAGCGIHNAGEEASQHNGIHSFHLDKNCSVTYLEKHLGTGGGNGGKILNPITNINMKENSLFNMETLQIGGVTSSVRTTKAKLGKNAKLLIKEKILTTQNQVAKTNFDVNLVGENSSVDVVSRSVAKDNSYQNFYSCVKGKNKCFGHVACDGILTDNARIDSTPKIVCENVDATLVHEAAIGKIAGEQLIKLMTLGLNEQEAEDLIIKGFLK